MDNEIFPWNPMKPSVLPPPERDETTSPTPVSGRREKILARVKALLPYLAVPLVLLLLYVFSNSRAVPPSAPEAATMEVFTPLFPIAKGEAIPIDALRLIPVKKSIFTKTQLFQVINVNNLHNIKGQLVAKKALFPNKVLFWNDLELKKNPAPKRSVNIIYSP